MSSIAYAIFSEDYAFCRRWRDIGGKVHVDLLCKLMHLGQHLFPRGDLAESLRLQGRRRRPVFVPATTRSSHHR